MLLNDTDELHYGSESGDSSDLPRLSPFHGLLVYDPWSPTSGVATRRENLDAHNYRVTLTAHLALV